MISLVSLHTQQAAEKLLVSLGALKSPDNDTKRSNFSSSSLKLTSPPSITALGRTMSQFPVAPRYAKMLALGGQHGCLPYVIALVACLSVKEIFAESDMSLRGGEEDSDEEEREAARKRQSRVASRRRMWAGKVGV